MKAICVLLNFEFRFGSLPGLYSLRECWTAALARSSQLAGHKAAMLQWAVHEAKTVINLSVLHVFFTCDTFNL